MPEHRDDSSDGSADSGNSSIERMRKLIAAYESCEDPELASDFLATHGLTYPTIAHYRRILARNEHAPNTGPGIDAKSHSAPRPRRRRARVAPPSRTYDSPRPAPSSRRRSSDKRYAVVVLIIELP